MPISAFALRGAALLAAVGCAYAQAPGVPPRALDEYECIFHKGVDSQGVSLWFVGAEASCASGCARVHVLTCPALPAA